MIRLHLARDSAACSAWPRHTMTVKNDGFCSRRPLTATRNTARAIPDSVERTSGSSGAGSGGFSPRGCRVPASPARTAACVPLSVAWAGVCPAPRRITCPPLGGRRPGQEHASGPRDAAPDPRGTYARYSKDGSISTPGGAVVLRHTAATLLLSEGEHPKLVQELLGHAQVSSTLDRYSHMTPRLMSNAAAVMDRLLDEDA